MLSFIYLSVKPGNVALPELSRVDCSHWTQNGFLHRARRREPCRINGEDPYLNEIVVSLLEVVLLHLLVFWYFGHLLYSPSLFMMY